MSDTLQQHGLYGQPIHQLDNQQTKSHEQTKALKNREFDATPWHDLSPDDRAMATRQPPAHPVETAFRHGWWIQDRQRVLDAMKAAGVGQQRIERFVNCGNDAVVEYNAEQRRHRIRANYCGDRWCYSCQKARAKQLAAAILAFVLQRRSLFITLTIKADGRSLIERRRHLLASYAKLRRHKLWRKVITGGACCTQVTRGENGDNWHVHLHVLAHGSYLCSRRLSAAWLEATGDSSVVKVLRVTNPEKRAAYVARYATKGCERDVVLDPEALSEAIVALRGARMLATFGTFWGCRVVRVVPDNSGWTRVGRLVGIYHAARRGEVWATGCLRSLRVVATGDGEHPKFDYVERVGRGAGPPGRSDSIDESD